jgi:hypothetical protein
MLRQFAGAGFVVLIGLGLWNAARHGLGPGPLVLIAVGALLGLLGAVQPQWLKPVFIAATLITFPIGWVISHLILGVMYYGLITPVGLFFRWTGRDALALRPPSNATTYWAPKPVPDDVRRYFRQY